MRHQFERLIKIVAAQGQSDGLTCIPYEGPINEHVDILDSKYGREKTVYTAELAQPIHIQLSVPITPPLQDLSPELRDEVTREVLCRIATSSLVLAFDEHTYTLGVAAKFPTTGDLATFQRGLDQAIAELRAFIENNYEDLVALYQTLGIL